MDRLDRLDTSFLLLEHAALFFYYFKLTPALFWGVFQILLDINTRKKSAQGW